MSNGAPCGACKFLRRKCVNNCIFAPHFNSEQGAARFAAVHKIFGASNVTKLLHHIPMSKRSDAVVTICYEAQARLSDPVYGCVATIVTLQHQVASLQGELMNVQMQLSKCVASLQQQQQHQHQQQQQQPDSASVYEAVFNNPTLSSALALGGDIPSSTASGFNQVHHHYRPTKEDFCSTSSPPPLVSIASNQQSGNPQALLKGTRMSLDEDVENQQLQQFWPGTSPTG